jgi:hypothetical protein
MLEVPRLEIGVRQMAFGEQALRRRFRGVAVNALS